MKIQKQFIPLIDKWYKQYEFRNSDEHFRRFYKVNDKIFWLDNFKTIYKVNYFLDKNDDIYTLKSVLDENNKLIITKQEYDWLKTNWDTYFKDKIYIGIWTEVVPRKLEVIDND